MTAFKSRGYHSQSNRDLPLGGPIAGPIGTESGAPKAPPRSLLTPVRILYAALRRRRIRPSPARLLTRRASEVGSGAGWISMSRLSYWVVSVPVPDVPVFCVSPNNNVVPAKFGFPDPVTPVVGS